MVKTLNELKVKLIQIGNNMSRQNMVEGFKGGARAKRKAWQVGYLTALSDVIKIIEEE